MLTASSRYNKIRTYAAAWRCSCVTPTTIAATIALDTPEAALGAAAEAAAAPELRHCVYSLYRLRQPSSVCLHFKRHNVVWHAQDVLLSSVLCEHTGMWEMWVQVVPRATLSNATAGIPLASHHGSKVRVRILGFGIKNMAGDSGLRMQSS